MRGVDNNFKHTDPVGDFKDYKQLGCESIDGIQQIILDLELICFVPNKVITVTMLPHIFKIKIRYYDAERPNDGFTGILENKKTFYLDPSVSTSIHIAEGNYLTDLNYYNEEQANSNNIISFATNRTSPISHISALKNLNQDFSGNGDNSLSLPQVILTSQSQRYAIPNYGVTINNHSSAISGIGNAHIIQQSNNSNNNNFQTLTPIELETLSITDSIIDDKTNANNRQSEKEQGIDSTKINLNQTHCGNFCTTVPYLLSSNGSNHHSSGKLPLSVQLNQEQQQLRVHELEVDYSKTNRQYQQRGSIYSYHNIYDFDKIFIISRQLESYGLTDNTDCSILPDIDYKFTDKDFNKYYHLPRSIAFSAEDGLLIQSNSAQKNTMTINATSNYVIYHLKCSGSLVDSDNYQQASDQGYTFFKPYITTCNYESEGFQRNYNDAESSSSLGTSVSKNKQTNISISELSLFNPNPSGIFSRLEIKATYPDFDGSKGLHFIPYSYITANEQNGLEAGDSHLYIRNLPQNLKPLYYDNNGTRTEGLTGDTYKSEAAKVLPGITIEDQKILNGTSPDVYINLLNSPKQTALITYIHNIPPQIIPSIIPMWTTLNYMYTGENQDPSTGTLYEPNYPKGTTYLKSYECYKEDHVAQSKLKYPSYTINTLGDKKGDRKMSLIMNNIPNIMDVGTNMLIRKYPIEYDTCLRHLVLLQDAQYKIDHFDYMQARYCIDHASDPALSLIVVTDQYQDIYKGSTEINYILNFNINSKVRPGYFDNNFLHFEDIKQLQSITIVNRLERNINLNIYEARGGTTDHYTITANQTTTIDLKHIQYDQKIYLDGMFIFATNDHYFDYNHHYDQWNKTEYYGK